MFEKKCSLCGGKIVHGRCVDCGLDATKNDKNYRINQSSCEHEPLTHVHTSGQETTYKPETYKPEAYQSTPQRKIPTKKASQTQGKRKVQWFAVIALIVSLLGAFAGNIESMIDSLKDPFSESVGEHDVAANGEHAEYSYVERELSETGEHEEITLTAGYYQVGSQIPEGNYVVNAVSGEGITYLSDGENHIYISQGMAESPEYDGDVQCIEDYRLYKGAWLTVGGNLTLDLVSENAQMDAMDAVVENTATETKEVDAYDEDQTLIVGKDLTAGVYDATSLDGYGFIELYIPGYTHVSEEDNTEYSTNSISLDSDGEYDAVSYKNIALPEGSKIIITGANIQFTPSGEITSTDYSGVWEQLY
ncbi:MAG: hypothetical protein PHQ72_01220 [Hespellia sp.]|nr:hypothetical protein [Hespellia sp.]